MNDLRHSLPDDRRRVVRYLLYFFFTVATAVLGKTARNTLFLSRFPTEALPWAFISIAVAIAAAMPALGWLGRRFDQRRLTLVAGTVFGVSLLAFVGDLPRQAYALLYVWIELGTTVLFYQYWQLASVAFTGREAKRRFGLIGAGAGVANIVVGLGTSSAVAWLGTMVLIPATAGAALASMLVVATLPAATATFRGARPTRVRQAERGVRGGALGRHLRWLTVGGMASTAVFVLVDYQFKAVAATTYSDARLAELFGLVYAATGVGSLITQLAITGPVLTRFGVRGGLALLPFSQLIGSLLLAAWPVMASAFFLRAADRSLRFSVDQASRQILWMPVDEIVRNRVKPVVEESARQLAQAAVGLLLLGLGSAASAQGLTAVTLPLILVWLGSNRLLRRSYVEQLRAAVTRMRPFAAPLEVQLADRETREVLRRRLVEGDERERRYVLGLLEEQSVEGLEDPLARLWEVGEPATRLALLRLAERHPAALDDARIQAAVGASDARVRAAAVRAAASRRMLPATALESLLSADPDRRVRLEAAAGRMALEGGSDSAASTLLAAIDDVADDSELGGLAIRAAGEAGLLPVERLASMLRDPRPPLRNATLEVVAQARAVGLLDEVVACLHDPGSVRAAQQTLASFGSEALPRVLGALREAKDPWPEGYRTLARLSGGAWVGTEPSPRQLAVGERQRLENELEVVLALGGAPGATFCNILARRRLERRIEAICELAACVAPDEVDAAAHTAALRSPDARRRSDAVEHLEGVLPAGDWGDLLTKLEHASETLTVKGTPAAAEGIDAAAVLATAVQRLARSSDAGERLAALQYRVVAQGDMTAEDPAMLSRLERAMFLQGVPLFRHLQGPEAAEVADIATDVRLAAGARLFATGDMGNSLFVVRSGTIGIHRQGRQVAVMGRGDCFGELAALDAEPRTADAVGLEDCELLEIEREDFLQVIAAHPHVLRGVLSILTSRIREITGSSE